MSTYKAKARNPWTGEIEEATWIDDYYGKHKYGVKFDNGDVADPRIYDVAVKEEQHDE